MWQHSTFTNSGLVSLASNTRIVLQVSRPCPRPSPSPRPDVPSSGRAQATGFPGVRRHPWVRPTSGPPPPPLLRRPVARSSQPGAHLTRDVASSDSEDRGQHRARERTSRHVFSDLIWPQHCEAVVPQDWVDGETVILDVSRQAGHWPRLRPVHVRWGDWGQIRRCLTAHHRDGSKDWTSAVINLTEAKISSAQCLASQGKHPKARGLVLWLAKCLHEFEFPRMMI